MKLTLGPPTDAEYHDMSYELRHADWQLRHYPTHLTAAQLLECRDRNTPEAFMAMHFEHVNRPAYGKGAIYPRQCGRRLREVFDLIGWPDTPPHERK